MTKILIADDNRQIVEVLAKYVNQEGIETDVAYDGEEAWQLFLENDYDGLLIDIMMPKIDGYELARRIRHESMVPILMITAKGEDYVRIMGLDIGADDYIVKPFSLAEVMARLRAVLRRVDFQENQNEQLKVGELRLDRQRYEVTVRQKEIKLTKKEFELLWTLVEGDGRVFPREELLDRLWGYDYFGDSRTVDTHIKRLRAKLPAPQDVLWEIQTIRGVGYKFNSRGDG